MRVIAGTARGTILKTIESLNTRPTTDRVKEAVFSSIQFDILDRVCLDAFAGSGALGIEALSRGAQSAIFVDQATECQQVIKANLTKTGLIGRSQVFTGDVFEKLKQIKGKYPPFDLVFLDPPYGKNLCEKVILQLIQDDMLKKNAIIVIEHDSSEELNESIGFLSRVKSKKYGSTFISTYREAQ